MIYGPPLTLLASTITANPSGYALINGTGSIITWTAPNDELLHRVYLFSQKLVTSTETGGQITFNFTDQSGTSRTPPVYAGGAGSGLVAPAASAVAQLVKAGTTVTVYQGSALTGGAAVLWAEIWGS
jgi:hypothetical protein